MKIEKEMFVEVSKYISHAWYDPIANIWFKPNAGIIPIPAGTDTTNIDRYFQLNYLVDKTPVPIVEKPIPKGVEIYTPGQLLGEDNFRPEPQSVPEPQAVELTTNIHEDEPALEAEDPKDIEVMDIEIDVTEEENIIIDLDTMTEITDDLIDVTDEDIEDEHSDKVACQYCGNEVSPRGIKTHEKACKSRE